MSEQDDVHDDGPDDAHEDRYERWLSDMAEHLRARGISCALGYDDRPTNNRMYLGMYCPEGFSELAVARGRRGKATVVLLSESRDAAAVAARELDGAHREIRRMYNAKRKFLHMVERISMRLANEFDERARGFPEKALEPLARIVGDVRPMTGIAAHRHVKKSERRGDEVVHGASIAVHQDDQGVPVAEPLRRALRYDPSRNVFQAHGSALHTLQNDHGDEIAALVAAGAASPVMLMSEPVVLPSQLQRKSSCDWAPDACDLADCGLDIIDLASCIPSCDINFTDIGGCDTPDCGGCDVPDCSL